jgi:hypothetical protein
MRTIIRGARTQRSKQLRTIAELLVGACTALARMGRDGGGSRGADDTGAGTGSGSPAANAQGTGQLLRSPGSASSEQSLYGVLLTVFAVV